MQKPYIAVRLFDSFRFPLNIRIPTIISTLLKVPRQECFVKSLAGCLIFSRTLLPRDRINTGKGYLTLDGEALAV